MIFPVDFNFLKTTIIRSIIAEHMTRNMMSWTTFYCLDLSSNISGSTLATSPGPPKPLPARPGSSTLSTTLATTSWSGPRPSSRTPSSSSMLPPSVSGECFCSLQTLRRLATARGCRLSGGSCSSHGVCANLARQGGEQISRG